MEEEGGSLTIEKYESLVEERKLCEVRWGFWLSDLKAESESECCSE